MPFLALATTNKEKLESVKELKSVAFGSCNDQDRPQVIWGALNALAPQLFIWGGDNIYGDATSVDVLQKLYAKVNKEEGYQNLKEKSAIIGTWDDHDYGENDSDFFNPIKEGSKKALLDFLEEPENSERRKREGVYKSYTFGPQNRRAKVVLLDTRFNLHSPKENSDILGSEQWEWLERELGEGKAKINLVVSGISVVSDDVPRAWEWADYPKAFKRLQRLLKKTSPSGLVFLSGDKHFSSIYKNFGHLEFINSGMTHTAPWYLQWAASLFYPNIFFGRTFGHIGIDWEKESPKIHLRALDKKGKARISKSYSLAPDGQWQEI